MAFGGPWDNIKLSNICVTGTPKERIRKYVEEMMMKH